MPIKNKLLILVAIIQILFFVGWYNLEQSKLRNPKSKTILVKTVPHDPRDYLSGNYFTLRYDFSNPQLFLGDDLAKAKKSGKLYAILRKQGQYHVLSYFSLEKPNLKNDEVAIVGNVFGTPDIVEYGIEKYFINENEKQPKFGDKIEVKLVIGEDMSARIYSVKINDVEIIEIR